MELQKSEMHFGGLLENLQLIKDFKLGQFGQTTKNVLQKYIYHLHLNPEKHQNVKIAARDTAEWLIKAWQPAYIPLMSKQNIKKKSFTWLMNLRNSNKPRKNQLP